MGEQPALAENLLYQAPGYPYIRVYFTNLLDGRAVNTTVRPSAVSRQGNSSNNTCKIKKNLTPRWVGGHQAHLPFGLIYPKPSFNKVLWGTYFVPSTVHTKVKTSTPVCPQGAPLTWQVNAALSQRSTPPAHSWPQYLTDATGPWILRGVLLWLGHCAQLRWRGKQGQGLGASVQIP